MPTRIVREGINSSHRINALSPGAELFYRRLMNVADDYGRYYAAPGTLRGACWPTCPEKVTDKQVSDWLRECSTGDNPLISIYESTGCRYLVIENFGQQTRSKSKFPEPANHLLITCESPVHASRKAKSESESESLGAAPQASAAKTQRGTRFTGSVPDEWLKWPVEHLAGWDVLRAATEAERFRDYWIAQPGSRGVKLNWESTWRNWCRNAREPARNGTGSMFESARDRERRELHEKYQEFSE